MRFLGVNFKTQQKSPENADIYHTTAILRANNALKIIINLCLFFNALDIYTFQFCIL